MSKKILVVGLGRSGLALIRFFARLKREVIAYDDNLNGDFSLCPAYNQVEEIPFHDVLSVVSSPGIAPEHRVFSEAKRRGILIHSEMHVGLKHSQNIKIGITGTNGKSTVTSLIAHILNQSDFRAHAVGNIGVPITSLALDVDPHDILVVELSSFQIDSLTKPCLDYAAILNISPDHLDRYRDYKHYAYSKCRIAKLVHQSNRFFCFPELLEQWPRYLKDVPFSPIKTNEKLFQCYKMLKKSHQTIAASNFDAAVAICLRLGVSDEQVLKAIDTFKGLPHRCEFVKEIHARSFFNDSKATNVESVIRAVSGFSQSLHIIMGGDDKGLDYSLLKPYFFNKTKGIYLIGQAASKMVATFSPSLKTIQCSTLKEAVVEAYKRSDHGEIILLSPGTSSYDMFKNFEHRGDEFKKIVMQLAGEKNESS